MVSPTGDRPVRRSDVAAMWFFIVAGVAIVGATLYSAIVRIVEGLSGGVVQVPATFSGTIAQAPIGPGGEMRDVELEHAMLATDGLSLAGRIALVLEQLVAVASVTLLVTCLVLVTVSVMRGRVFSRRNSGLVGMAGIAALGGIAGVPFFGNMVANDAFRAISDGTYDNVTMSVDVSTLILAAFVFSLAATVFTVGDRLQRETDLLV
ncbi:MAG: hypothetical protein WBX17_03705 [Microbacterium sp.]